MEFSVLDLFDTLDSQLKKMSSGGGKTKKAVDLPFVRYDSWLDAHQFVIKMEKNRTLDEERVRVRLLAQAGLLGADDASISDGDLLGDDGDSMEISDEEVSDKESVEADSDDDSAGESGAESDTAGDNRSESSSNNDEDVSDDEEGDEVDEAAAEAAYLKLLQDEEFESELRKLTMEALEKGKVTARTGAGGKVSSQMPSAPQFIAKKPAGDQIHSVEGESSAVSPFVGGEGITFKLFKRGNKGKQEEVQLVVPKDTNLARRATKQDDAAAKERDLLKARVLQYEAESRESADAGGNVYLDDTKLQVIRNRPLTIETINKNFGKSTEAPFKVSERFRGRGPGRGPGRGRGAGRLFNPGSGRG